MTLSILLEDKFNQTGLCIPLLFGDPKLTDLTEIDGSEFQVYLKSKRNDELHHSAKKAGQLAFELLQNEGYVHRSIKIYLKIEADINHVRGSSADLLFAIAVMTAVLDKDYPSIAATGSLFKGKKWQVSGVEAVPHKLEAAFKTLPNGGIIFYPKENDSEINNTLRLQAEQQGIELYAVEWLNQVAERLDIETALFYSGECPYRGLEAFRAEHHNIYFGRQAEVETVIVKLKQREQAHTPGLLIISASGTGKSSFVQAGLIPALSRGQLALQDRRVFSAVWQPSDMGETVNESSLVQSLIANWQKQPELLAIKSNTIQTLKKLSPTLASALPANRRFVWVLNQMEELFTLNFSRDLLKTFCEFLQALQKIGVWVIATLRNDFYDR